MFLLFGIGNTNCNCKEMWFKKDKIKKKWIFNYEYIVYILSSIYTKVNYKVFIHKTETEWFLI